MARWVWLEAVTWAESRWSSGSVSLEQLVSDLRYLLDDMEHGCMSPSADLAQIRAELDRLAASTGTGRHHRGETPEAQRVLQHCAALVYRSR